MQLRYSRTKETADRDVTSVVPAHLINALGVPQFYKESGNCWFASMLWCCLRTQKCETSAPSDSRS